MFAPAQTKTSHVAHPFFSGSGSYNNSEILAQDAARTVDLEPNTLMHQDPVTGKWKPLTSVSPLVSAEMLCAANGTNLAGMKAVTDGEFSIVADGVSIDVTGLDFSLITALDERADTSNTVLAGRLIAVYDSKTTKLLFISPARNISASVSVLSAVSGGSGTDISGTGFLNGLTSVGVVTSVSGVQTPDGIYRGYAVATADIVAADVTGLDFLVKVTGVVAEDDLVMENSLTPASILAATGQTIRTYLRQNGLTLKPLSDIDG